MAETVLKKMASTLDHDNGYIIVTGFTQSFLNPVMIDNAGLEVLHGSLPSVEAGGLESGFKRIPYVCVGEKRQACGKTLRPSQLHVALTHSSSHAECHTTLASRAVSSSCWAWV